MSAEPHGTEDSTMSEVVVGSEQSDDPPSNRELANQIQELQNQQAIERQRRREAEKRAERAERAAHASISLLREHFQLDNPNTPWNLAKVPVGNVLTSFAREGDLENVSVQVDQLWDVIEDLEADENSGPSGVSRETPIPLYRMLIDLRDGQDAALGDKEKRSARLFERFVNKAKGEHNQNVTPDGQKFTMNTEQATEILHDEGLLDDVAESSYSKTAGRAMRHVQRCTIVDGEEHTENCKNIEECTEHGLVEFKAGKPNMLRVSKEEMVEAVRDAEVSDSDVRTTDDGENAVNSPEEGSVSNELDELTQPGVVNNDD